MPQGLNPDWKAAFKHLVDSVQITSGSRTILPTFSTLVMHGGCYLDLTRLPTEDSKCTFLCKLVYTLLLDGKENLRKNMQDNLETILVVYLFGDQLAGENILSLLRPKNPNDSLQYFQIALATLLPVCFPFSRALDLWKGYSTSKDSVSAECGTTILELVSAIFSAVRDDSQNLVACVTTYIKNRGISCTRNDEIPKMFTRALSSLLRTTGEWLAEFNDSRFSRAACFHMSLFGALQTILHSATARNLSGPTLLITDLLNTFANQEEIVGIAASALETKMSALGREIPNLRNVVVLAAGLIAQLQDRSNDGSDSHVCGLSYY